MNNVVVICLDTVRKDFFDKYAPELRSLSDRSYSGCRTGSSWSVPSHASFLTGELPHQHGSHAHNVSFSSIPAEALVTKQLTDHTTISVGANPFTSEEFGWDDLFDHCIRVNPEQIFQQGLDPRRSTGIRDHIRNSINSATPLRSIVNGVGVKGIDMTHKLPISSPLDDGANDIIEQTLDVVNSIEEPYFLFANFMEAHGPHERSQRYSETAKNVPASWDSGDFDHWDVMVNGERAAEKYQQEIGWLRVLYQAAIEYLDTMVASFVRELQIRSDIEVTVIITADHGENLGYEADGYQFNHTGSLSEGLLHVPFEIINPSGELFSGPTPLAWSQLNLPKIIRMAAGMDPHSNIEALRYVPAELVGGMFGSGGPDDPFWQRAVRCLYDNEKGVKYVWDSMGAQDVYRIDEDRTSWQEPATGEYGWEEIHDPAAEIFDEDINEYKARAEETGTDRSVSDTTEERLQDLGYV